MASRGSHGCVVCRTYPAGGQMRSHRRKSSTALAVVAGPRSFVHVVWPPDRAPLAWTARSGSPGPLIGDRGVRWWSYAESSPMQKVGRQEIPTSAQPREDGPFASNVAALLDGAPELIRYCPRPIASAARCRACHPAGSIRSSIRRSRGSHLVPGFPLTAILVVLVRGVAQCRSTRKQAPCPLDDVGCDREGRVTVKGSSIS